MTIKYHVLEETLLAYAAGELDNASSLLVATHLALCPKCRRAAEIGDEIGGALIETVAPATMGSAALDSVMGAPRRICTPREVLSLWLRRSAVRRLCCPSHCVAGSAATLMCCAGVDWARVSSKSVLMINLAALRCVF